MNETTYLGDTHHDRTWKSTLTDARYRWEDSLGWTKMPNLPNAAWSQYKAGQYTSTIYAYPNEKFVEVS